MSESRTYRVTQKAWLLACPVWLAHESAGLVPIPRSHRLDWWFEVQLFLQDELNALLALWEPEAVGYVFHAVKDVEPFEITV